MLIEFRMISAESRRESTHHQREEEHDKAKEVREAD
jgi:hypothetical protein